jgi:hypothetical protein
MLIPAAFDPKATFAMAVVAIANPLIFFRMTPSRPSTWKAHDGSCNPSCQLLKLKF